MGLERLVLLVQAVNPDLKPILLSIYTWWLQVLIHNCGYGIS